ncbi:MAG: hypothetical protein RL235_885 [Chlamydiota bacterium]|jgi:AAA family ATP:ADP antiporter
MDALKKRFVILSMCIGFLISFEYGISRPAAQSLFITALSAEVLPWVWFANVFLNFFAVWGYNRYLSSIGPQRMFAIFATSAIAMNGAAALLYPYFPLISFFQFIWKDVYILLMFKQLWSIIHCTIEARSAKSLYGIIFGAGTVGSVLGGLIPWCASSYIGTSNLLFLTLPIYLCMLPLYRRAFAISNASYQQFKDELPDQPNPLKVFSMIRGSKWLTISLVTVMLMQISVGLIEYRFNMALEQEIVNLDARTAYCGQIVAYTNLASLALQSLGAWVLVHLLKVQGIHLFIPILLLTASFASRLIPTFGMLSASFCVTRAVDFSLFGVARELLYIPMRIDEKFRAKAFIDVFAYRGAKAVVSIALLAIQWWVGKAIFGITGIFSIAIFAIWIAFILAIFRRAESAETVLSKL